jgi:uncharacterized protein YciI
VQFLVLGVDGPEFDGVLGTDLHEEHWSYMDTWADVLVARGPTLTPDGETHTGSLHVVDVPDLTTATRFALEEPYAQAGWYAQVTVQPVEPCAAGTMWDKPRPEAGQPSSFVRATFDDRPRGSGLPPLESAPAWLYLGLVLSDDTRAEIGIVGLVDLGPDQATLRMADVTAALGTPLGEISAQRWQRGGRQES